MNRGAQKLRAWRRQQSPKLTQAEFGQRFGLDFVTVSRLERGVRLPPLKVAVALEQAGIADEREWLEPAVEDGSEAMRAA